MPNKKLTDHYVLITGASSGIGANLTHQFAKDGYPLILTARHIKQLNTLADSLKKKYGVDVQVVPADLSVPGSAKSIFDFTEVAGLRVGVLVNDAGSGYYGNFSMISWEKQRETIMVNAMATTELTKLFLPNMLKDKRGGIMNLASIAAYLPGPNLAVYHATKAYILSLSLALAEELAPFLGGVIESKLSVRTINF